METDKNDTWRCMGLPYGKRGYLKCKLCARLPMSADDEDTEDWLKKPQYPCQFYKPILAKGG